MPLISPNNDSLLDFAETSPSEWIVVFEDTDDLKWWQRPLKPGFRHVSAIRWDGYNWIYFNLTHSHLVVQVLHYSYRERPETFWRSNNGIKPTFVAVKRRISQRKTRYQAVFALHTCVESIKSLLGIDNILIVTPYQLYRYLTRSDK